jgi:hypothetical protein
MRIELHELTIEEVSKNYIDNDEEGVYGYDGKLNIRPKYQRNFVYDPKERNAVIDTINKGFPLNVMYWIKNEDGTFEVLDGQQRTVSFCQYVNGDFSVNNKAFHNLTQTERERILNYKLMIYFCEGNDLEKLEWFKTINIAGKELTPQELRNAVYTGTWVTDAKSKFSKNNCVAYNLSKDYITASASRQEILELALKWISQGRIENYMSIHQHYPNANELWTYFKNVIDWVKLTFPNTRKEMKGVDWGPLYDRFKNEIYVINDLENRVKKLLLDEEIDKLSGIYPYILTGDERYLNLRSFKLGQKTRAYERQEGICPMCHEHFSFEEMEGDHITPWHEGGKTTDDNCQMLCKECNRRKGGI